MNELLQAVLASPDDRDTRRVYADWLTDRGDPLGEFIALQCGPKDLERELALWAEHGETWLGELGLQPGEAGFDGGLVEEIRASPSRLAELGPALRRCPVRRLRVLDLDDLPALLELPVLARVRELDLTGQSLGEDPGVLACSALEGLSSLILRSTGLEAEELAFLAASPHLRGLTQLDLQSNGLTPESAHVLAPLQALVSLDLSYNELGDGVDGLLSLPALRALRLRANDIGDPGARALSALPLRSLDLSINRIGARGARALLAMPGLQALDLRYNYVSAAIARRLSDSHPLPHLDLRDNTSRRATT